MEPTSTKKQRKIDVEKQHVLGDDFSRIFVVLASENGVNIDIFSSLFRTRRFCKNRAPVEARARFFRSPASKNRRKIDAKMHSKITSKKILENRVCASILASQNLPKSLPKATWNEACCATLWKLLGNRRKSTQVIVCKASKWLFIWLGLLHPLICPSSP